MSSAGIRYLSDLAATIGVRPQTLNKWVHAEDIALSSEMLFKLSDACHVSARWLSTGVGYMSKPRHFSPRQVALIQRFDALSPAAQKTFLARLAARLAEEVQSLTPDRR
jgi:hypothetical protein